MHTHGTHGMKQTHEAFVQAVAALAIARLPEADQAPLHAIKLVYGAGQAGLRGVTYFVGWNTGAKDKPEPAPFVEVCAFGQESWIQVAGTTIHELAHVLAGWKAGHDKGWKDAAARLGLRRAKQAGHRYMLAGFDPDLRRAIAALPKPDEGEPVSSMFKLGKAPKGCQAGIGTKGGKSRGIGGGSRLRLFECACLPPVKVRAARDELAAHCDCCNGPFERR